MHGRPLMLFYRQQQLTCVDQAVFVSTDIDGLDIGELEVPLQVWKNKWSHEACRTQMESCIGQLALECARDAPSA